MLLIITRLSDNTPIVVDMFNDSFLLEVIAMYLESDGIYGELQSDVVSQFASGLLVKFTGNNYDYVVIEMSNPQGKE